MNEPPERHPRQARMGARWQQRQDDAREARSVAEWLANRQPGQPAKRLASTVLEDVTRRVRARLAREP